MADEVTVVKFENTKLQAENERLKKQLSEALANSGGPRDELSIVQQVQALANGYLKLRDQLADVQKQLDTRNEDNRRLQKMVKDLSTTNAPKS